MGDCNQFIQPLDLQCLLVNTFAEGMTIFIFIAFIFIGALGATFKMMNTVVLIMFAIFGIILAQYVPGIYLIIVLLVGLVVANIISRSVKN